MPNSIVSKLDWAGLEDMAAGVLLDEADVKCLIAVRAVLKMHGKLHKFGLARLQTDSQPATVSPVEGRHKDHPPGDEDTSAETSNTGRPVITVRKRAPAEAGRPGWQDRYCRREVVRDHYVISTTHTA